MYPVYRRCEGGDRCPRCSRLNVDFMDLGFGLMGCYDCGLVFVRKSERGRMKEGPLVSAFRENIPDTETADVGKEDLPNGFVVVEQVVDPLKCLTCGIVAKSKLGLQSHLRKHR
jgi:hypothetical protein